MLRPADEQELSEAVRDATGPLKVIGGGTRPIGNPVEGALLTVSGISGITLYEPGALTIVAEAGTPLAEVEAALASENQCLPFEPMDHRAIMGSAGAPTIGGVVAANVSGPRRIQAGACRDSLIGVRFVDGSGVAVKNGGRVMKNVTGYDLVKLMAGSFGTLGILSEVAFKLLPAKEATAVLMLDGLTMADAVQAMSRALASPFEVSGAAHVPDGAGDGPITMIRVEGFEASVRYRVKALADLLAGDHGSRVAFGTGRDGAEGADPGWRWIRDAELFAGSSEDLWRISVKPSDATLVAARLDGARLLLDWGGGLIWAGTDPGTDLRTQLSGIAGHATLIRAEDETRRRLGVFHPEPEPVAALSRGLRAQFDPRGILNPGLMA